ncbi:MAG: MFS transporter [bacterium]|nr:MFS transporter [bacterium]
MHLDSTSLLKRRQFLPLFLTQFFGAFNDNAFKLAMLTLISYHLSHNQAQSEYYQALAGALFILPFFLFSATSGQLADKYDKSLIARLVKVFELLLMIIGGIALYRGSILLMMVTLTGMGIQSSFFGPIKYSILLDHLSPKDLLAATGIIEASTFIAILLGTTLGTLSIGVTHFIPYFAIFIILCAAFLGLISSLFIPSAPSRSPNLKVDFHVVRATINMLKETKNDAQLLVVILTISWFWLIGAILLTKLPDYTHYVLNANPSVFALFLSLFSTGIAAGSLMINMLLKGRITLSIVPWAMLAFSVFTFDLYLASPNMVAVKTPLLNLISFFSSFKHWRISIDLFMLAFSSGLFVVPLYTYLQIASSPELRSRTIAANNIFNALFMVVGTLFVMLLLKFSAAIPEIFLILGLLNLIVTIFLLLYLKRQKDNN